MRCPRSPEKRLRVAGVRLLACDIRGLKRGGFLDQFSDKTPEELRSAQPPSPKLASAAQALKDSVLAGAAVMKEVLR